MRVLLVFATFVECQGIKNLLIENATYSKDNTTFSFKSLNIEFLITGVGMISTCYELTKKITASNYDLIINVGIAGAFDRSVPLGSVFFVSKDRFADLGVEDADGAFMDVYEIGLVSAKIYPFQDGWIYSDPGKFHMDMYKHSTGVTLNKVTGSAVSINNIKTKYNPDIESMEGAACFFVANTNQIPCLQLRAISNHVEPRDKSKWDIPLALKSLEEACFKVLEKLNELKD